MNELAWIVLARTGERIELVGLDRAGERVFARETDEAGLRAEVVERESAGAVRWVWNDTRAWYPRLLAAGRRIARAHDLRLVHALVRNAAVVDDRHPVRASREWDVPAWEAAPAAGLFEWEDPSAARVPSAMPEVLTEFEHQRQALDAAGDGGRLRLLAVAESAGALIAAELESAGLPWDGRAHDALLRRELGERDATGRPRRLAELATQVRSALGDPTASLDSHPKLLRALHRAGVLAESTSKEDLRRHDHPVVAPLLEYKRLARLYTANGWAWLDEWVHDGRFRPVYVPAGVVTGRWASAGGGALQIPRALRPAVRADEGWCLVIADVAQLEPRVLAAMSGDAVLAAAARGRDLYAGIVGSGAVATRDEAKVALLGAMYGATTGESGRLVPRLRRTYPRAMGLVDEAARTGETGGTVSTWLGRTSPRPEAEGSRARDRAGEAAASEPDAAAARRSARDRGRFTRNFIVQGTAAEWALAWLADLRTRLAAMPPVADADGAHRSGPVFATRPHLAFFLHDEIIVHTPLVHAPAVADAVRAAAETAGVLLFGERSVDFPLDLKIADTAEKV